MKFKLLIICILAVLFSSFVTADNSDWLYLYNFDGDDNVSISGISAQINNTFTLTTAGTFERKNENAIITGSGSLDYIQTNPSHPNNLTYVLFENITTSAPFLWQVQSNANTYFSLYVYGSGGGCGANTFAFNTGTYVCSPTFTEGLIYRRYFQFDPSTNTGCLQVLNDDNSTFWKPACRTGVAGSVDSDYDTGAGEIITLGMWGVYEGNIEGNSWGDYQPSYDLDEVVITSDMKLFATDENDFEKTVYNSSETIELKINLTYSNNNTPINNSNCTIDVPDVYSEHYATAENFTLCGVGCDYENYFEALTIETGLNPIQDLVHIEPCHEQLAQGDITVTYACNGVSEQATIDESNINLCSEFVGDVFLNFTSCINEEDVNVTVSYSGVNARRKSIEQISLDRQFLNHTLHDDDIEFINGVYEVTHQHEFYTTGFSNLTAQCLNVDSNLDNSDSLSLTITPLEPFIFFNQLFIDDVYISDITNNMSIEFENGSFMFSVAILDDNLETVNATLYNNSGHVIATVMNGGTLESDFSSDLFRDLEQSPFNLTVYATDFDDKNTTDSFVFNVVDTVSPTCTGLNDDSGYLTYTWNVNCIDESFFSFNITCDNGFSYQETGMNLITYSMTETMNISGNVSCDYEYADGHTKQDVKIKKDKAKLPPNNVSMLFDDIIEIISISDVDDIEFIDEKDRIKFKTKSLTSRTYEEFIVKSPYKMYYMGDSAMYKGWFVTGDYWIDFENDNIYKVYVTKIDDYSYHVRVQFKTAQLDEEYSSIGKTIIVTGTQEITSEMPPDVQDEEYHFRECPNNTTQDVFMFSFITILCIVLFLYAKLVVKIPILNMSLLVPFFYLGGILLGCHVVIGGFIIVMTLVFMVLEVLD